MLKLYSIIIVSLFSLFDFPDCAADFNWKVGDKDKSGNYTLDLILKSGESDQYTFELYDLLKGEVIRSAKGYFNVGQRKVIFENVKPSTYTVIFSSSQCPRKAIKGKGIVLE